jgi:hypothetical protein
MSAAATSPDGGALTWQWYSRTTTGNTGGTPIEGATTNTYAPPSTAASGVTYYYVVVTNTNTEVNGAQTATEPSLPAMFLVSAEGVTNAEPPVFDTEPSGTSTYWQNQAATTLSASAHSTDGGAITYQWYGNGSPVGLIDTSTPSTYTPLTTAFGTVIYTVVATNTNTLVNGQQTATQTSSTSATVTVENKWLTEMMDRIDAYLAIHSTFGTVADPIPASDPALSDPIVFPDDIVATLQGPNPALPVSEENPPAATLADVYAAIYSKEKYLELDLSASGVVFSHVTAGNANAGKAKIVALTLPDYGVTFTGTTYTKTDLTTITDGSTSTGWFGYYSGFSYLKEITGAEITTIGTYTFYNLSSLIKTDFPKDTLKNHLYLRLRG